MKGIILAGGLGTRLSPLTRITNKHLLPVYDKPMIFYPIQTLVDAGITDIMLIVGGNNAGDFLRLLGNGKDFGLKHINYAYQKGEGGIADALALAEHFSEGEKVLVMLGDNLIGGNIKDAVSEFEKSKKGAKIILKEVPDPENYGVPVFKNGKIINIIEKPKNPPSNYAVIGIYMFDNEVFKIIGKLKPSQRGELEITDVNNMYLKKGQLSHSILEGWWADAGSSIEGWFETNKTVALYGANKKG
ncbi:MAG: spore coat protein [Candidatus Firestonebacteria bacterium RIFOXYC2_FULL_39_67]|nr:MAG: spore coat protein [Candidatus Firestonebacteria bacterium RIFOXYD2_FULL_39_29]OGF53715.1 MAG: spore coat protein [Candidatus Firestonebacteria bacterium RIFOXYC2_FULL_39_67]